MFCFYVEQNFITRNEDLNLFMLKKALPKTTSSKCHIVHKK